MTHKFKNAVLIGRFQPYHAGHEVVIKDGLRIADIVTILVGTANAPRTFKNPFTYQERVDMIKFSLSLEDQRRLKFIPLEDNMYNDTAWATKVQDEVSKISEDSETAILGHDKDETTYYLKMFPQWKFVDTEHVEILHATQIREIYFKKNTSLTYISAALPQTTLTFLNTFNKTEAFNDIVEERTFVDNYKKQFVNLPYEPTFFTVDGVVVQSGHVLMVRRKSYPGKGLWALPGGFLDAKTDKSTEDAMIREVMEETSLKIPEKVIRGSIKGRKIFDAIGRSARGRTLTEAFFVELFNIGEWNLPKIKAGDDAEHCAWIPLSKLKREEIFEDHYDIITYFTKI